MDPQLKKEIVLWLLENENRWQRINSCVEEFRAYIYNNEGNFLIGGEEVYNFIVINDTILYKDWLRIKALL